MKNITGLNMNWNEYKEILAEATNDEVILTSTNDGEWDYLCSTDSCYDTEDIYEVVGNYLGVRVSSVIIDISNDEDCVVVITE